MQFETFPVDTATRSQEDGFSRTSLAVQCSTRAQQSRGKLIGKDFLFICGHIWDRSLPSLLPHFPLPGRQLLTRERAAVHLVVYTTGLHRQTAAPSFKAALEEGSSCTQISSLGDAPLRSCASCGSHPHQDVGLKLGGQEA